MDVDEHGQLQFDEFERHWFDRLAAVEEHATKAKGRYRRFKAAGRIAPQKSSTTMYIFLSETTHLSANILE